MDGIHERAARLLGWTLKDVQSYSLPALREMVRPLSPKLAVDITEAMQRMGRS